MKTFNLKESEKRKDGIDIYELEKGVKVEREHAETLQAIKNSIVNGKITVSDEEVFDMIARDHLRELPDYYTRLAKMEKE